MLFGLIFTPAVFAQGYTIEPAPSWVKPAQIPDSDKLIQQNSSDGEAYLLVDFQWRVGESQHSQYRHIVTKALNTTGVSESSQISIDFDPVYETLVLHSINIQRDGRTIDRRDRTRINLIQHEEDLDYQIYDGSKTLSIFIDDVRTGDIVEYSYTIKGANPVFCGHFAEILSMQWNVPVGRLHYRVLWSSARMLHIQNQGTDIEPAMNTSGQYIEYEWARDNIKEVIADSNVPEWYAPYPVVYLSDFASGDEVTDWAWPLYRPIINTPMQKTITAAIMEQASTPEKRTLAALRFVQDEVRYFGIEMGESSHKPNTPDKVIEQRFGDCKDKSRLLVSLLQGMGIEASSVLVNTRGELKLNNPLPTPTIFDHAIVLARINGNNYWLDPTRNYQSGNLDAMYQPDYDSGLVVSDQSSGLTNMSDDLTARHSKVVSETFDFRNATDKPVTYQIISRFERYYAVIQRKQFSETNPVELQQSYLNYMAHYFSDIEFTDKISVTDDSKLNRVTVNEQYSIPNAWTKNDDGRYIFVNFEPYLIADHIKIVEAPIRTMPYAVTHPVRYQHTTRILLPEGSYFDDELITVEDSAFSFTRKVDFSDDVLVLDYAYESHSDHVKPEHIQSHKNNIREVLEISSFQIQMPDPALGLGEYRFDPSDINWQMVVLILLAMAATTFLCFKYIYLYDPPYHATEQINRKLEGIGGWLVLPALSLIINPLKIAIESSDGWYIFLTTQWSIVGDTTGADMLITIAIEMVNNVAMFVMGLFLIIMFFTRRRSFPRLFIIYFVFCTTVFAVDLLAVHLLPYPELEIEPSDYTELIQMTLYTVIWSVYFIRSKRVKATFTRMRKINRKQLGSPGIEREIILQDTA